MNIWTSLHCLLHLTSNTKWEFLDRKDFNLNASTVNHYWQQSLNRFSTQTTTWNAYKSLDDYELVSRAAEYQALVYCKEHMITPMIGKGRLGQFELLSKGQDKRSTHHWLILLNHQQKSIIVTLRGTTNNPVEIWNDLDVRAVNLPCDMFPNSCRNKKMKIHHGFLNHFLLFGEEITNILSIYHRMYRDYDMVLTAHSLGAATGALLAWHWIDTKKINFKAVYLFGLPIVGNSHFAKQFTDRRVIKIFNENDIVPFLGYIHGEHINTKGIWIKNKTMFNSTDGYSNLDCLQLSWLTHSYFFSIPINDNYCKLSLSIPTIQQEPLSSFPYLPLIVAIIVVLLLIFCVMVWYVENGNYGVYGGGSSTT